MQTRRAFRPLFVIVLGLCLALPVILWLLRRTPPPTTPKARSAFVPPAPPAPSELRPRRAATPEAPLFAREELLTLEGDDAADLAALTDLTRTYLERPADAARPPIGFNEDLARALADREALGEAAIPADHPALRDGQLIDRWGTPWHVHPLSADVIELRGAGPDRRLFTADDLVTPR